MRLHELTRPNFSAGFLRWFSGSVIVDKDGHPLVVYHGTSRNFLDFEVRAESHDTGIFFSRDTEYAGGYANQFDQAGLTPGANIRPCYLAIRNPFFCLMKPTDIELKIGKRGAFTQAVIDHLIQQGFDGVITGMTDYEVEKGYRSISNAEEIVAFNPSQVRSATADWAMESKQEPHQSSGWSPSPDEVDEYNQGGCYALALAVHKLSGLPMVGLLNRNGYSSNWGGGQEHLEHVMVLVGPDQYLDINGVNDRSSLNRLLADE